MRDSGELAPALADSEVLLTTPWEPSARVGRLVWISLGLLGVLLTALLYLHRPQVPPLPRYELVVQGEDHSLTTPPFDHHS